MADKRIAVCMAAYNGEKYIGEQLASILTQLGQNDVIVVSDDGSTDGTYEIIKKLADKRIKYIVNNGKHGSTYNFRNALKNADADIYFLADQDDVWLPERVEKTLKCLEHCDFCVCDSMIVDKNLNIICESRFEEYKIKNGFLRNLVKTRYIGCCMAFTRRVYDRLFPFPDNVGVCPHDFWVTLVGEAFFKSDLIREPLMLYRRHGGNVSNGGEKSDRGIITRIVSRAYCVKWLIRRSITKQGYSNGKEQRAE